MKTTFSRSQWFETILTGLMLAFYGAYVVFTLQHGRGPIDYETFMEIGARFHSGGQVYGVNSFYPLPYVLIFAAFSALPRSISLAVWLAAPVIVALVIARGKPYALLFAPTFAHFVGGQSAIFGLLGFWGYRRQPDPGKISGGIWLGLTLLKPQMGLVACAWAVVQWVQYWRKQHRVPLQAWGFLGCVALLYLPSFIIMPDWPLQWLAVSRPLFYSAMAGIIPRLLIEFLSPSDLVFWLLWLILSLALLLPVLRRQRPFNLDTIMLWGFAVSPILHNYDLIQLIPLLENKSLRTAAMILSVPAWILMFLAYTNKDAWAYFTLFAPVLLLCSLIPGHPPAKNG